MQTASNYSPAGRAQHAARLRRPRQRSMRVPTALFSAVLLISGAGVAWKLLERVEEKRAISELRASLDTQPGGLVYIRLKTTPVPPPPDAPAKTPVPTPSPDPEMQQMQERMDNLQALQAENGELLGWIVIPDTAVDYPVMFSPTRQWYYLDRDFSGNRSKSGLPFLDESCDPVNNLHNLLIYGHNMKDGSMFAGLHAFSEQAYYTAHRTMYFITPAETMRYSIIAAAYVEIEEDSPCRFYQYTRIANEEEYAEYARIIKEASLYPDDMDAFYGDELITLCTCSKHAKEGRLIIVAKRTV